VIDGQSRWRREAQGLVAEQHNHMYGRCCVTAPSDFDLRKGGQSVPWDIGLVPTFTPGSVAPSESTLSVFIHHSNIPVPAV
jgi:hypothetical protein